jgi:hypothetical protein
MADELLEEMIKTNETDSSDENDEEREATTSSSTAKVVKKRGRKVQRKTAEDKTNAAWPQVKQHFKL